MNELLQKLRSALAGTSAGTRAVAGLCALALVAIAGLAGVLSSRPHYELAFSGLTDHELALVCKALSEAGIPFEQSQPPGPFVVYVDAGERSAAYMAAYGAGALDKPLEGILSGGGMGSVFDSAEERAQGVRKREWQEMEKMLEELDFVVGARVRTSAESSSPLAGRDARTPTASVTLRVAGGAELTAAQTATVANLVSRGLGIAKGDLVVSDQTGRALYDGEERSGDERGVRDLLAHQHEHDRRLALEANTVLAQILGPSKARVTVSSEWDYAQSTLRTETSEKGPVVQETKTSSEKPVSTGATTVAGLSANVLDPDAPRSAEIGAEVGVEPPEPLVEKTSEEKKEYAPSVAREERVRFVPELKRLSVALFLDQSVQDPAKLQDAVKAAVGFVDARDGFSSVVLPFVVPDAPAEDAAGETAAPAEPSPLVEKLLRHGVEIVSALVFLGLLLKTLKGSKGARGSATAAASARPDGVDPELLARVQVDELLKSDPARVGEILARWAREEPVASGR
jgi:flagellar biosynthesis/type III secretory pathway M-ring protein FliF/YscJ